MIICAPTMAPVRTEGVGSRREGGGRDWGRGDGEGWREIVRCLHVCATQQGLRCWMGMYTSRGDTWTLPPY